MVGQHSQRALDFAALDFERITEGLDDPPATIAAKALRVNLSDLAAKGARGFAYLLALGLGDRCDEAWVAAFSAGLAADQARYGVALLGGDTVRSGEKVTEEGLLGLLDLNGAVR